ncbi:cyclopropane-fatty-acyl-phospholipid synthase [Thermothelomyces heterothallicus CBS 203.75]
MSANLRDKLIHLTYGPAIAIAKPAILSLLSSIEVGTLILIDDHHRERHVFGRPLESPDLDKNTASVPNGNSRSFADGHANPAVTLTVTSPNFYLRLLLLADMGFAESYLLREVVCSDLTAFFRLFILNRARLNNGSTRPSSPLLSTALSLLLLLLGCSSGITGRTMTTRARSNTAETALLNASAHYDLGNALFAAFLSADMTYSCPVWAPLPRRSNSEETLEAAQFRKIHRVIASARIKRGDHVLEIGTGWGSFAIEAVKTTGCRVTTATLSREQKAWVEERVRREGLGDKVDVLLLDYRAIPAVPGGYDKIVSIEMVEAVGKEHLGAYFGVVHRLLKREGGIAVLQCITMPEGRQAAYEEREDFINRYIFPGGYLPSITQLLDHITAESNGTLIVESVANIGGHYARTLRLWRERFLANYDAKIRQVLAAKHPDTREEELDVFRRKWEYYFSYCEAGFLTKTLGDVIITVGREGAMELMEDIPL